MKKPLQRNEKIQLLSGILSGERSITELDGPEVLFLSEVGLFTLPGNPTPPPDAKYVSRKEARYYTEEELSALCRKFPRMKVVVFVTGI